MSFSLEDLKLAVAQAVSLRDQARGTRVRLRLDGMRHRRRASPHPHEPLSADEESAQLAELLGIAVALADADMGNIQRVDRSTRALRIVVQSGFPPEFIAHFDRVVGTHAACGHALKAGAQVAVESVERNPLFEPADRLAMLRANARAVLSTPLRVGGRIEGMLSVHYRTPRGFTSQEKELFDVVAAELARFLEGEKRWASA